jgi:DNA processing protein
VHRISIDSDEYPQRLYDLETPPKVLTTSGPLAATERVVAIVGSREASEDARDFAFALAYHLARAGVVVVSGGAIGIDRAAHEGAMAGDGPTWVVLPTGHPLIFPPENEDLFDAIAKSESSRLVWPYPDEREASSQNLRGRNGTIVGLAHDVVVIQAHFASGSRNAARWTRRHARNLWLVPGCPWDPAYSGTIAEGAAGARTLWSIPAFFEALELPITIDDDGARRREHLPPSFLVTPPRRRTRRSRVLSIEGSSGQDSSSWTDEEKLVFSKVSNGPRHRDDLVHQTGLTASATITALLTLSLKDVVVEGPDGFFRRMRTR